MMRKRRDQEEFSETARWAEMNFQIAMWEMERDHMEVSYTVRGPVPKVHISKWKTMWD